METMKVLQNSSSAGNGNGSAEEMHAIKCGLAVT